MEVPFKNQELTRKVRARLSRFHVEKKLADTVENAFAKVCEVFGIESLNKHQEDAIKYVVKEKKDVFVNLPTGFGKSLIYQALPLVYSCLHPTIKKV